MRSGRVGSAELHAFAIQAFGYTESHSTWLIVYFFVCVDLLKVDPTVGLHEAAFAQLTDALLSKFDLTSEFLRALKRLRTNESKEERLKHAQANRAVLSHISWIALLREGNEDLHGEHPEATNAVSSDFKAEAN
eukprot:6104190-Amphidinium_carterae.1